MALVLADRVQETTTTTGTGTVTLAGAVAGFQSFAVIGNANTTYYCITSGTAWEVGIGTYTSAGTTLARTTILSSSAGGAAITLAGTSNVFCTYPASNSVYEDASGIVAGFPISGGSINNTPIGGTTPAAGTFTTVTGRLTPPAGTATAGTAPLKFTTGTNLTTAEAGAVEYDGEKFFNTEDSSSGRGYFPSVHIFRLAANGAAIGPAIANFFGANSAIQLAATDVYQIEAYCYFLKTTAGTVTVTITTSLAPVNLSGIIQTGAVAGGNATGVAQQIALHNSTATAAAFGATGSLTTAANHAMQIKLLVVSNAADSNLRFNFTESAGTITPLRNSYFTVTKLPTNNAGVFVA